MTIAERRSREAYDRENPWRPIGEAKPGPDICELRASDMVGLIDFGRARFFLHDGTWYRIDPPTHLWWISPMEFRPIGVKLSRHRLESIVRRADYGTHEYRGGELYRKPKQYKLYWRADD